jgi:hypothetical protein
MELTGERSHNFKAIILKQGEGEKIEQMGLESLFRTMGIKLKDTDKIRDLNKPVGHLIGAMARMRESKS